MGIDVAGLRGMCDATDTVSLEKVCSLLFAAQTSYAAFAKSNRRTRILSFNTDMARLSVHVLSSPLRSQACDSSTGAALDLTSRDQPR